MQSGLCIDFAHRTFRWDSEATIKAHVHCVIIGFSRKAGTPIDNNSHYPGITSLSKPQYNALADLKEGTIYDNDKIIKSKNINAYLLDAPTKQHLHNKYLYLTQLEHKVHLTLFI